jgi:hypothetical protein
MALGLMVGAGALLGGLAGAQGRTQTTSINVGEANALETQGYNTQLEQLKELEKMLGAGSGFTAADAGAASTGARDLVTALQGALATGGMPTQADIASSNTLAQQLFAPQQTGLNQAFEQQRQMSSRQAARMGRASIDPVLTNLLSQDQTRQQSMLNAQQGQFATQFAQQMPQQRLALQSQLSQAQAGLASQALANRQALLSLGQQLTQSERNWRLGTASQTSSQPGNFLTGAIAGAGTGFGTYTNLMNAFSNARYSDAAAVAADKMQGGAAGQVGGAPISSMFNPNNFFGLKGF